MTGYKEAMQILIKQKDYIVDSFEHIEDIIENAGKLEKRAPYDKLVNNKIAWKDLEITIEVNPGTVSKEKLENYKMLGINRLSIGLQSTSNRLLKEIGRIHTYEDFLDTYNIAKEVGFDNINVDLMIALPNQSIKDIKESLEKIVFLNPNHISVYSLIVEEETLISKWLKEGKVTLPSDEEERRMYWYVKNFLELSRI